MPAAAKLKLGDNIQGHTYLGGNPNDQSSWVNVDDLMASGKTGDEFMNTLKKTNPQIANTVLAMSQGRQKIPAGRELTDPHWGAMFQIAQQYDPTLDGTTYARRQKTALDFGAGGTAAQNLRNLNQAIGHLHDIVQAVPGVAGHSGLLGLSHLINYGQNFEADMAGDPNITAYETPRVALASELASVFKGKGTSNEKEVTKLYDLLSPNAATAQKYQAAKSLASLMKSRVDELGDQYNQGFSTTKDSMHLLNPNAQKQFMAIQSAGDPTAATQSQQTQQIDPQTHALFQRYKIPTTGYSVDATP